MAKERRAPAKGPGALMTTTLWNYHSQNYPGSKQGNTEYVGATPSYVIWNLLQRYTKPQDLVLDPMAGSGTTLDVARDLDRRALGYDVEPTREDIFRVDARKMPLETGKADFVFVDPPYSNHIQYSGRKECIGELDARKGGYFEAMALVIAEIHRVLKHDRYMALYVCDSFKKDQPFVPIGFELFAMLSRWFTPVDVVAVVRHNQTLKRDRWHNAALEGNFFLRGFNHLFIMKKDKKPKSSRVGNPKLAAKPKRASIHGRKRPARKNP